MILALLSAHAERFSVSCMRDFLFASLWTFVFLFLHNKCSVEIVCQCFKTYIILKKSIDKIKKGRAMTMAFLYAIAVGKIRLAKNLHHRCLQFAVLIPCGPACPGWKTEGCEDHLVPSSQGSSRISSPASIDQTVVKLPRPRKWSPVHKNKNKKNRSE